jgi:hypothetical protein
MMSRIIKRLRERVIPSKMKLLKKILYLTAYTAVFYSAFCVSNCYGITTVALVQSTDPDEVEVGKWTLLPGSILIVKKTNNTYWLMQTDKTRSYYVVRGMNFLYDSNVQISRPINRSKLSNEITAEGGLLPSKLGNLPAKWDSEWWGSHGFSRNVIGEFVKEGVVVVTPNPPISVTPDIPNTEKPEVTPPTDPVVVTPPVTTTPPVSGKIKIPVGAIMWDGWYRDYWNDENPKYDLLINHVSKSRLIATEWMDHYNVVPFYGQYHEPENIIIRYNVKWSPELGRNTYDEMERTVKVRYDKTQADTDREIQYYAESGFDFFCFNYYNSDSPLSEARLQFVDAQNKRGMKMTFMLASNRSDTEIEYITDLMLKDYWFKIDGKPVLYFNSRDILDLPKYRSAMGRKGGGEIYVVYYSMGGVPSDFSQYLQFRAQAGSSYTIFNESTTAEEFIKVEVQHRENWMNQFKASGIKMIPTLTTGFENLHHRSSLDNATVPIIQKASLAQIEKKLDLVKDFINRNPESVPALLWYAGNEILESGNPIVPTKRKDGSIDTSMLDTIKKHLE